MYFRKGFKTFSSYNNIFGKCKLQPNKKWPLSSKPSEIFSDLNHKFIIIQMHNWHNNQDSKSSLNLLSKTFILSFIGLFYWSLSILWVYLYHCCPHYNIITVSLTQWVQNPNRFWRINVFSMHHDFQECKNG